MFKFNEKFIFIVFALCLFLIGIQLYLIIEGGFKEGKDLIYQILILFSLSVSSITFFNILYVNPKNKSK